MSIDDFHPTGRICIIPQRKQTHIAHTGPVRMFRFAIPSLRWPAVIIVRRRVIVKCVIFAHCLPRHTHLYMQLHGVYGRLATPIYGSDRSGTIYGRVPSFLNISYQLRFEDISWGHLVGVSWASRRWCRTPQPWGIRTTAQLL